MLKFEKRKNKTLSNLHVAVVYGEEVGFVFKMRKSKGNENYWNTYSGIGENAKFLGHYKNKEECKREIFWNYMVDCQKK